MGITGYRAWTTAAIYAQFGHHEQASQGYRQALDSFCQAGDILTMGRIFNRLGGVYRQLGETRKTQQLCTAAVRTACYFDNDRESMPALANVAMSYHYQGRPHVALRLLKQVAETCRLDGDLVNEALALIDMALVYTSLKHYLFALALYRAAVEVLQTAMEQRSAPTDFLPHSMAVCLTCMGQICTLTGHSATAAHYYREALVYLRQLGCLEALCVVGQQLAPASAPAVM